MGFLIAVVFFLIVAAAVVGPIILVYSRRQAREQKNFERGLKMIPLLIHLPPISEDTEANGRDVRDLIDENISKAQVIYNIIASTYEKGFKRKIYGQQHFAFEILSAQGFVYFYATVPIGLVEVVRQAVTSAYPAARLEEAEEHNIFNNAGKAAATTGGELVLKESFAYPIATYIDLKRDAMQGMLNSLASLGKEDGAAIQILLRPADPGWRKTAHGIASSKRKGEKDQGVGAKVFSGVKEVGTALVKPPEGGSGGGDDKPQLSDNEQQILNSIDEKTRYPAYEVLIRLVASSNITQTSQSIMTKMVAAFSQFDAPGKNGFKFEPAKDIDELVTSYILKFFPQDANKTILNSVELASIFHFPDQRSIPTTQLERQDSKQVDGPRNMPDEGLLLGYNVFRGVKKPIRLGIGDRQRHMYVVGQTGTGKSTFLENLALQDMLSGNGFAFVDPHGDTAEKLLSMVPRERTEDVIYFSPAEMDHPMGLNIFEFDNPDQKDFLIQEAINMLYKLYDPQHQGIMGPRYEHLFRNAALTVMADPAGGTFIDLPKLFRDPQYVKQKLQYVTDMNVKEFWQKEMPQSQRSNEFGEVVSWFVSKFGAFVSNEMMRNIIGQTKSSFNLRDIMDNKKILLVNLSKGRTGELNSKLLGMIFVMKFQAAAMSRANIPEKDRVDFSLYVDEFQNFSTDSFATIMSEARKYHLNLIVANQFTTQLTEEIRDAVFGNMGTIVAFRVGQNDVDSLTRYFQPIFDADDLLRVPNYNTITRTLVGGVPTQPFSMSTLPPLGEPNVKLSAALKQLSAAKFGKPKAIVEKDIFARIATQEPVPPAGAARPFGGAAPAAGGAWQPSSAAGMAGAGVSPFGTAPQQPQPAARPGAGSFLDEWMAKRGTPGQTFAPTAAGPAAQGAPAGGGMPPQPMVAQAFSPQSGPFASSVNPFDSPNPSAASPFTPPSGALQPGYAPQAGPNGPSPNAFNAANPAPQAQSGFQSSFAPDASASPAFGATPQSAAGQPSMSSPESGEADALVSMISRHDKGPAIGTSSNPADGPSGGGASTVKKKKRKKKSKSPSEMGGGSTSSLDESGGPSFGQGKLPNAEIDEDTPSADESYLAGSPSGHDDPAGADESSDDDKGKAGGPHLQHKGLTIQPLSAAEKASAASPQTSQPPQPFTPPESPMPDLATPPASPGTVPGIDPAPPASVPAAPADSGLIPALQSSSELAGDSMAAPAGPAPGRSQPDLPPLVMPQQAADEPKLMDMPDMPGTPPESASGGTTAPTRPVSPVEDHFSHGDTIYIDQNGNLQMAGSDNNAPAAR